jgi:aarF domain-containing kinase
MYKFKFRIPSYFSLVIRSLTVLEGIALSSDPNYKVLSSSYPWIARKVLTDKSPKLRSTLQEIVYKDGSFRIDRLESLLTESMRQPLEDPAVLENKPAEKQEGKTERDTRSLVKRLLTFALTEQGDFVRELVLDELAKGIDAFNRIAFDAVAHNIQTRSPIALPVIAPVTEDEDRKNLENLQQILNIFMNSDSGSGVRTVAGMTGGRGGVNGATNRATRSTANSRSIAKSTEVERVGSQNGAAMRTTLAESNDGKDLI